MTRLPTYQLPTLPQLPRLPKLPRLPGQDALVAVPRQTAPLQELTEEEERSITGGLLSTIEYVGESLDKPGAALRGVLAGGGAEQLLHAVPFSDALGIAPEKRYSGRELLETTGLIGPNQTGLDVGDVAGFGAEVLLDPTWLFGVGGLTGLGKATRLGAKATSKALKAAETFEEAKALVMPAMEAARAGVVGGKVAPSSMAAVAQQIRRGERSLFSIGLPGTSVKAHFGAGSEAAARLYEKIGYGGGAFNPLVWTRGLFSATSGARSVKEFMAGGGLQMARDLAATNKQLLEDVIVDFMPHMKGRSDRITEVFDELAKHHGGVGDEMAAFNFAREALEAKAGLPQGDELLGLLKKHAGLPADADLASILDNTENLAIETASYLDALQTLQKNGYARISELGGNAPLLNDIYIGYNARRGSELLRMTKREKKLMRSSGYRYWMNRKHLGDVPGGAPTINAIARDWTLTGTRKMAGAETKALREELRSRLTSAGVAWQEEDPINVLQELWLWHGHLKEPFERTWATSQVDELGQLLDEAGNVRHYTKGPWRPTSDGKLTPITRETERTRWLEGVLESTVATGGTGSTKAIDPEVTRLARYFRSLDPEVRAKGIYDRNPLIDTYDYLEALAEQESTLRSIHHFMGQKGVVRLATPAEMTAKDAPDVGLRDAIRKIRIGTHGGRRKGRALLTDEGLRTFARNTFTPEQIGDDIDTFISRLRIKPKDANVIAAYAETMVPRNQTEIGKMIDRVNALYRGWLFTPFLSSHSRNLMSGLFQSWADGEIGIIDLLAGYKSAISHLRKGTPLQSADVLETIGALRGIHGKMAGMVGEDVARGVPLIPMEPGTFRFRDLFAPFGMKSMKAKGMGKLGPIPIPQAINPLAVRGVQKEGQKVALNALHDAGERAYAFVEYLNRVGYAEALARKGFAPSEINRLVKRAQYDYGKLSSFERNVMQRVVTFYGWPRNNLPHILTKLATNPGGRMGQSIRAARLATGEGDEEDGDYTPKFLREGMAIPISGPPEARTFIQQSGLPIDDLNKMLSPEGVGRTATKLASSLHPLIQLPLKLASGRDFYTGRKLKDLQGVTGYPLLDTAIVHSPLSRVVSEARRAKDDRKTVYARAMSFLTGVKAGTYDTEYWELKDLEQALKDQLERDPEIRELTEYYVPRDVPVETATPLKRTLRLRRTIGKKAADLRASRK